MDVLRRAAGSKRKSPRWNRGTWWTLVILGGGLVVFAGFDATPLIFGHRVAATAEHCKTTIRYTGRPQTPSRRTACDVTLDRTGESVNVATLSTYTEGDRVALVQLGSDFEDLAYAEILAWLAVPGALVLGLVWWLGYPTRSAAASAEPLSRRHQIRLVALVMVSTFAVIAVGVAISLAVQGGKSSAVRLSATVETDSATFSGTPVSDGYGALYQDCTGAGAFADLHANTQVTISDSRGVVLVNTTIEAGFGTAPTCEFTFNTTVPGKRGPYQIAVGAHPALTFTESQLSHADLHLRS